MNIERVAPPRKLKHNYKPILAAVLSADGEWVRVHLDDLGIDNKYSAASRILVLAGRHRVRVETTTQDGFVYIRLRKPDIVHGLLGANAVRPGEPVESGSTRLST